eukprot:766445-Hanusia_phi.AAC.2
MHASDTPSLVLASPLALRLSSIALVAWSRPRCQLKIRTKHRHGEMLAPGKGTASERHRVGSTTCTRLGEGLPERSTLDRFITQVYSLFRLPRLTSPARVGFIHLAYPTIQETSSAPLLAPSSVPQSLARQLYPIYAAALKLSTSLE